MAIFGIAHVAGRVYSGEVVANNTGATITVPNSSSAQFVSLCAGSVANPATVPVYITYGDETVAAPDIASPATCDFLDPGQTADIPAGVRKIKVKTSSSSVYVRYRIVY